MELSDADAVDGLQICFEKSQELGDAPTSTFVCIGDVIEEGDVSELLKGHGTQSLGNKLVATVCGRLERINKLVSVRPLKTRYHAEVGDVVIGRIVGIAGGQWKVDINARQDAMMGLSSVVVPGHVQRRKTAEDESNMRQLFSETDLISAEIQTVRHDGGIQLHTRSEKYGKLGTGQVVNVSASLVLRQRQHFHTLDDIGVTVIFGCNGMVWVRPTEEEEVPSVKEAMQNVSRLCAAVKAVERLCLPIYLSSVIAVYHLSLEADVDVPDMEGHPFLSAVAEGALMQRMQQ